eukprot:jgi/Bigna1/125760/aug1.1_g468
MVVGDLDNDEVKPLRSAKRMIKATVLASNIVTTIPRAMLAIQQQKRTISYSVTGKQIKQNEGAATKNELERRLDAQNGVNQSHPFINRVVVVMAELLTTMSSSKQPHASAIRLRIQFATALNRPRCWHLLDTSQSSQTIRDFCNTLADTYGLEKVLNGDGLKISVSGFYMPPDSDVRLLRDGDMMVVSISKNLEDSLPRSENDLGQTGDNDSSGKEKKKKKKKKRKKKRKKDEAKDQIISSSNNTESKHSSPKQIRKQDVSAKSLGRHGKHERDEATIPNKPMKKKRKKNNRRRKDLVDSKDNVDMKIEGIESPCNESEGKETDQLDTNDDGLPPLPATKADAFAKMRKGSESTSGDACLSVADQAKMSVKRRRKGQKRNKANFNNEMPGSDDAPIRPTSKLTDVRCNHMRKSSNHGHMIDEIASSLDPQSREKPAANLKKGGNAQVVGSGHFLFEEDEKGNMVAVEKAGGGSSQLRQNALSTLWTPHKQKQRRILEDQYRFRDDTSSDKNQRVSPGISIDASSDKDGVQISPEASGQIWVPKDVEAMKAEMLQGREKFGNNFYAPRHLKYVGLQCEEGSKCPPAADYSRYPELKVAREKSSGFIDLSGNSLYPSPGDIYAISVVELINWTPVTSKLEECKVISYNPKLEEITYHRLSDSCKATTNLDSLVEVRLVKKIKKRSKLPEKNFRHPQTDYSKDILKEINLKRKQLQQSRNQRTNT